MAAARQKSQLAKQILPEPSSTMWKLGPERYAEGASSSASINLQGLHGGHVLIIADEAPGIESDIWNAIEGIRSGGFVRVLKLGNPTVSSGEFFDAFGKNRAIHNCISISAFDTPNFQRPDGSTITEADLLAMSDEDLAYSPFPSLISRSWVKERLIVWGRNHPQYKSRVLAEFPGDDPYSVYHLSWIEKAKRDPTEKEIAQVSQQGYSIQVGIDVAGAGSDETTLVARVGGIVLEQHAWPDADCGGKVSAILGRLSAGRYLRTPTNEEWIDKIRPLQLGMVVVDTIGVGYNFALHLADQGFPVWGFIANARPRDQAMFQNQKAEAAWALRMFLEQSEISGLEDTETVAQLSSLRYLENSRGQVQIESKDERNRRGIPGSPDRAEGCMMAFCHVVPAQSQHVLNPVGSYIISQI